MNLTPIYIAFAGVAGVAQYGALLLNQGTKKSLWKYGLYVGMIGSAYAGSAMAADNLTSIELYPCLTFMGAAAFMLSCVVLSYYLTPTPETFTQQQRDDRNELKHRALVQVGIGLGLTICVATCVGFTNGQTADSRVQQSFAGVVYRLADEVKSLHEAVTALTQKVNHLEHKADQSARNDSIARKQSFRNQAELKRELIRKHR